MGSFRDGSRKSTRKDKQNQPKKREKNMRPKHNSDLDNLRPMTEDETKFMEYLRGQRQVSSVLANRIEALMRSFALADSFFDAASVDVLKQWRALGHENDLGLRFAQVYAFARKVWKTREFESNDVEEAPKDQEHAQDESSEAKAMLAILTRKYSVADLKTVVDVRELAGISAINTTQMAYLLDMRDSTKQENENAKA